MQMRLFHVFCAAASASTTVGRLRGGGFPRPSASPSRRSWQALRRRTQKEARNDAGGGHRRHRADPGRTRGRGWMEDDEVEALALARDALRLDETLERISTARPLETPWRNPLHRYFSACPFPPPWGPSGTASRTWCPRSAPTARRTSERRSTSWTRSVC